MHAYTTHTHMYMYIYVHITTHNSVLSSPSVFLFYLPTAADS